LDRHARRLGELAHLWEPTPRAAYAYVLGLYLGDGYLARHPRTMRLVVSLDTAYPEIVGECAHAISQLMPRNPVRIVAKRGRCADVVCYSTLWPDLIPQHGAGPKHRRPIVLERWQQLVVESVPKSFIRGLFHSDGSYFQNPVRSPAGKHYSYDRYMFTNHSRDIRELFRWACGLVGVETRLASWRNVSVARRDSVAKLNEFLGPKR
jgi:hypothetical protein